MFLKMRKTESNNMVAKDIKISQEMKNKSYLSIEKIIKYGKNKKMSHKQRPKNSKTIFKTYLK